MWTRFLTGRELQRLRSRLLRSRARAAKLVGELEVAGRERLARFVVSELLEAGRVFDQVEAELRRRGL